MKKKPAKTAKPVKEKVKSVKVPSKAKTAPAEPVKTSIAKEILVSTDKEQVIESKTPDVRPLTLTIVAVLFGLFGIFYLLFAAVLLTISEMAAAFGFSPAVGAGVMVLSSIVCILTAIGLWKMKLYAGIAGGLLLLLNILSGMLSMFTMPSAGLGAGLVLEIFMLVLIIMNWKKFK